LKETKEVQRNTSDTTFRDKTFSEKVVMRIDSATKYVITLNLFKHDGLDIRLHRLMKVGKELKWLPDARGITLTPDKWLNIEKILQRARSKIFDLGMPTKKELKKQCKEFTEEK